MFALLIFARELRSRAAKPWTAWVRVVVGLLASLMAVTTLVSLQRVTGFPILPGKILFESLSSILFVFCLVEGVRQTADCISQEKREGTLGLLFLTELSGLDVVLGKLAATSVASFYALLAAFPVMAVAPAAGGVTAGEFWRTVLVLLNTLFASLAWGIWASARHRVEGRGLWTGLAYAFAFALLPWVFELALRPAGLPNISLSVALHLSGDTVYCTQAGRFWMTLLLTNVLSWVLLMAAGRVVESRWREDTPLPSGPTASQDQVWGPSGEVKEPSRIQEYWPMRMEEDPAAWLARRQLRHHRILVLSFLALAGGPYLTLLLIRFLPGAGLSGLHNAVYMVSEFLPVALVVFITSRYFAEARRGGEMELLLSTPLSSRELVAGQWRALWAKLRVAFIVSLAVLGFIGIIGLMDTHFMFPVGREFGLYQAVQCVKRLLVGLAACWLGLYLGLRMESTLRAVGYGVLWIVVGPWLASLVFWLLLAFLGPLFAGRAGANSALSWSITWSQVGFGCVYLAGVLWWSRRQLIQRLRELAAKH